MRKALILGMAVVICGLWAPAWSATPGMAGKAEKPNAGQAGHPGRALSTTTPLSDIGYVPIDRRRIRRFEIRYRDHRLQSQTRPTRFAPVGGIYRPISELPGSGHDYLRQYSTSR